MKSLAATLRSCDRASTWIDDHHLALTSSLICLRAASAYDIRAWLARSQCVCQCMFMNIYENAT